jgi:hypothetical protein
MKSSRRRVLPPIVNFGRFRIDYPSRDRSVKDNLKFVAFVAVLVVIFMLLYQLQARWLMARNERAAMPDPRALLTTTP